MADNHYRIYLADERMNILEMIQINFDMENTCISNNNKVFVSNETDASSWDYFSFDVKKLIPQGIIGFLSIITFFFFFWLSLFSN